MRSFRSRMARLSLFVAAIVLFASSTALSAQAPTNAQAGSAAATTTKAAFDPITAEGYIEPPEPLRSLVDAPRNQMVNYAVTGNRRYLVRTLTENMPALAQFGAPHYNLAGWQVDSRANRSRALTSRSLYGVDYYDATAGKVVKLDIPAGARANTPTWSPDGSTVAFFALFDNATHIFLFNPTTGKSTQLTKSSVLATNVTSIYWTGDSKSIITVLVPDGRPGEPKESMIANEPMVRVNENTTLRTRTLPDVIMSPYEKTLLEYHMTGQLAVIDVKTKAVKKVGTPDMIRTINAAPDAMFFRITYLDKPFSYYQALSSFGTHEHLIDANGKMIKELARRTLRDGTQNDPDPDPVDPNDPNNPVDPNDPNAAGRNATRAGGAAGRQGGGRAGGRGTDSAATQAPDTSRRGLTWHPYMTGQMFFQLAPVAAGTPATAPRTDRVMLMPNPADSNTTKVLYETANRISAVRYSENGRIMFVTEATPPVPGAAPAAGGNAAGGRAGGGGGGGGGGGRAGGAAAGAGAQGGGNATTYEVAVFLDENNAKYTVTTARGGGGGGAAGGRGGRGGEAEVQQGRGAGAGGGGGGAGGFVTKPGKLGFAAVMTSTDNKFVYTTGTGPVPGDTTLRRPLVEKIEIKTGTRSHVYQSTSRLPETITSALDDDFSRILVRRESSQDVPQNFIIDVKTGVAKQITENKDIWNGFRAPQRETYYAKRADGLMLRVYVTKPRNYVPGTKMPALFWFYPAEFDSAAAYSTSIQGGRGGGAGGRGAGAAPANPAPTGTFPSYAPRTMSFITEVGYVLVEPDVPIVGEQNVLPNDNYVHDLVEGLQATINMLDTLKIIDRNRLALGGHSYGAFSTVNAMVNTSFFKAGIAGDGNYNRTLTPNGFQNERRDLWQGTQTYINMSPFLKADKLSGALLLYHSMEDQNVGTDPMNSPKLFHALQGLGKTVSMYMYPYEDHGPVARETVLDQWARWVAWLDKYVKNADKIKIVM